MQMLAYHLARVRQGSTFKSYLRSLATWRAPAGPNSVARPSTFEGFYENARHGAPLRSYVFYPPRLLSVGSRSGLDDRLPGRCSSTVAAVSACEPGTRLLAAWRPIKTIVRLRTEGEPMRAPSEPPDRGLISPITSKLACFLALKRAMGYRYREQGRALCDFLT